MRTIIITCCFLAFAIGYFLTHQLPVHSKIIEQGTDERGYTSVVFTEGKDTFALDYLTKPELDSLQSTFK